MTPKIVFNSLPDSLASTTVGNKRKRLYYLPRRPGESRINDYNPAVMHVWKSNMDLTFIGEKSGRLCNYVTKYACKAEKSHVDADFMTTTKSVRSALYTIALRGLHNREVGSIEAADTNLGHFLYKTDSKTVYVPLFLGKNRFRKIKPPSVNAVNDTDDVYDGVNWIEDVYPNRHVALENASLYQVSKYYQRKTSLSKKLENSVENFENEETSLENFELGSNLGYLTKRATEACLWHYEYNEEKNPDSYYYALLMLYKPWREYSDLQSTFDTLEDAFHAELLNNVELKKYHEDLKLKIKVNADLDQEIKEAAKNQHTIILGWCTNQLFFASPLKKLRNTPLCKYFENCIVKWYAPIWVFFLFRNIEN